MLTINTNLSSLIVQSNLKISTNGLNDAIERMTTGFKLNHAKDNAANYSISTSLTTKLGAYTIAEENAMMGLDMVQTASDSLSLISDKLSRMRALAIQAQNGTYGDTSLDAINAEANALAKEINRIQSSTEYNGRSLFKGTVKLPTASTTTYSADSTASTSYAPDLKPNADGFIKDVVKRDTSAMTSISTLSDDACIASGTYKIETKDDLLKFRKLVGQGSCCCEFVLANDIDMSGVDWNEVVDGGGITFDGNGYKIKGLNNTLFGDLSDSKIKNLGLEDFSVSGAPLAFQISDTGIFNCYTANGRVNNETGSWFNMGSGLVGEAEGGSSIYACWSNAEILCENGGFVAGLIAVSFNDDSDLKLQNSFFSGSISGDSAAMAGLVGATAAVSLNIKNCFSSGSIVNNHALDPDDDPIAGLSSGLVGVGANAIIENCHTSTTLYSAAGNAWIIGCNSNGTDSYPLTVKNVSYDASANPNIPLFIGDLTKITSSGLVDVSAGNNTTLQVGIHSDDSSALSFNTYFNAGALEGLNLSSSSCLSVIDDTIKRVNNKQTELGAIQNRLESVLESIGVNINNLTSTRSTIKDADVAELSSEYIRNQILQQASATLLATANQNPSIALQLI